MGMVIAACLDDPFNRPAKGLVPFVDDLRIFLVRHHLVGIAEDQQQGEERNLTVCPIPMALPHQGIALANSTGFVSTGGLGFGLAADLFGMMRAVIFLPSIVGG